MLVTRVYDVEDLLHEVPYFVPPGRSGPSSRGPSAREQARRSSRAAGDPYGGWYSPHRVRGQSAVPPPAETKEQRVEQLIDTIVYVVRPEIWRVNGGPASIRYFNGRLIVTAPPSIHDLIAGREGR